MKKIIMITLLIAFTSCSTSITLPHAEKPVHINEYSITVTKRLDWAGPAYYRYNVYKNGKYEGYGTLNDSCMLRFEENRQRFVYFNLCNATREVYLDTKMPVLEAAVDSVLVKGHDGTVLRLTHREMRKYIKMWDKAAPNGLNRLGKAYDYEVSYMPAAPSVSLRYLTIILPKTASGRTGLNGIRFLRRSGRFLASKLQRGKEAKRQRSKEAKRQRGKEAEKQSNKITK